MLFMATTTQGGPHQFSSAAIQKVVRGELYPALDDRYQRRVDTRPAQIQQRNGLRGYQSGYSGGNLIDVLNNKSIAILYVRL